MDLEKLRDQIIKGYLAYDGDKQSSLSETNTLILEWAEAWQENPKFRIKEIIYDPRSDLNKPVLHFIIQNIQPEPHECTIYQGAVWLYDYTRDEFVDSLAIRINMVQFNNAYVGIKVTGIMDLDQFQITLDNVNKLSESFAMKLRFMINRANKKAAMPDS